MNYAKEHKTAINKFIVVGDVNEEFYQKLKESEKQDIYYKSETKNGIIIPAISKDNTYGIVRELLMKKICPVKKEKKEEKKDGKKDSSSG